MSPIWYARVPSAEAARALVDRSVLTKAVIELWGEGETWEGTAEGLREACGEERAEGFMREDETFKVREGEGGQRWHGFDRKGIDACGVFAQ